MLYEETLKQPMLDVLEERMSGIADSINALVNNGYIPSRNKKNILDWSILLFHAYENIDIFTKEQQDNLDIIYNQVIRL